MYFPVDLHVKISCNWENYPIFPLLTFPLKSYQLVDFHWITKTYFSIPMINYISRGTKRQFLFSNNIFGCVVCKHHCNLSEVDFGYVYCEAQAGGLFSLKPLPRAFTKINNYNVQKIEGLRKIFLWYLTT